MNCRFVCDPEEQLTSRSREIERAMRDMRFRELCKARTLVYLVAEMKMLEVKLS